MAKDRTPTTDAAIETPSPADERPTDVVPVVTDASSDDVHTATAPPLTLHAEMSADESAALPEPMSDEQIAFHKAPKKRYLSNVDRGIDYHGSHYRATEELDAIPEEIEETRDFKVGFILRVEPAPPAK